MDNINISIQKLISPLFEFSVYAKVSVKIILYCVLYRLCGTDGNGIDKGNHFFHSSCCWGKLSLCCTDLIQKRVLYFSKQQPCSVDELARLK
jgi:hypothetical protein